MRTAPLIASDAGKAGISMIQLANRQGVGSTKAVLTTDPVKEDQMAPRQLPPAEYLRQCFSYDPNTGALTWRERPREHFSEDKVWRRWNTRYAGTQAGSVRPTGPRHESPYIFVCLGGIARAAHRIIWAIIYGVEPSALVDHRDSDGTNNRLTNLREATYAQNTMNRRHDRRVARLGRLKGTKFHKRDRRWTASIRINTKRVHLGSFGTEEEAHRAYCAAAKTHFGDFARLS
jgi:hypothetical protein